MSFARRANGRGRLLLAMLLLVLVGCAPAPSLETRPVERTPYEPRIEELNRRLCEERGGRWQPDAGAERCRVSP